MSTLVPIWARPRPPARRPRFSRDQIAAAAVSLADAEGLDAVSMRRVAERLGAGTMSLYHYVRTKADLLALMDDAVMAEVVLGEVDLSHGWREAVTAIARGTRKTLVRHPWALAYLGDAQLGPNAMRHFEEWLTALSGTRLDGVRRLEVLAIVNAFVFGNVILTIESLQRGALAREHPEAVAEVTAFGLEQLRTGAYPRTVALFGDHDPAEQPGPPLDEQGLDDLFERGLSAVLEGLALAYGLPAHVVPDA